MDYLQTVLSHYEPFWNMGIDVDFVDMESPLEKYRLLIAPLNYMYRCDYEEKVRRLCKEWWYICDDLLERRSK